MNMENAAFWAFFWVETETKWLIQRYLGYKEMAPDHLREKNKKSKGETQQNAELEKYY